MPPSITVRSTIDVQDDNNVEVAIVTGFANFAQGSISLKPIGGTMTTPFPQVQAGSHYPLGPAANLITNHIRMIFSGTVGDPDGAVQGSFFIACAFYQNGQYMGSSTPISGKFAPGDALQGVQIICSFT